MCALPAAAQSLADVARAEEARRKAQKAPVKVYTNDDLGKGGEALVPPPQPAVDPSAKPGGTAASTGAKPPAANATPEESAGKDEKYWRSRITDARTLLQRSQAFYDALQSQINGLYAQFVATDDPAQRALVEQKRLTALTEQERVKGDISKQTKAIADIEDEARRANVPPGWLR
jgi:hypothetical protein